MNFVETKVVEINAAVISYRNRSNLLYKESTIQGEGLYNRFDDLYKFVMNIYEKPVPETQDINKEKPVQDVEKEKKQFKM